MNELPYYWKIKTHDVLDALTRNSFRYQEADVDVFGSQWYFSDFNVASYQSRTLPDGTTIYADGATLVIQSPQRG